MIDTQKIADIARASSATCSPPGIGLALLLLWVGAVLGCSGASAGTSPEAAAEVAPPLPALTDGPQPSVDDTLPPDVAVMAALPVAVSGSTRGSPVSENEPPTPADASSVPRHPSILGYNMDYPGDWSNVPPFIDQVKNGRAIQGECDAVEPGCDRALHLDLDAGGWVRSLKYKDDPTRSYSAASMIINTSNERSDIGQTFAVTWQGKGAIQVQNGAAVAREPGQNRLIFQLQAGNTALSLTDIDPEDPVRDLKVFRTDYEGSLAQGELFDPELIAFLAPFGSVRFMDWMQSNAPGQCSGGTAPGASCYSVVDESCGTGGTCTMAGRWSERPTADQPSALAWGQYLDNAAPERGTKVGGYPVETLVALANRAGVDPHFNMPADYQDDYVRAFAEYVRDNLGPGLTASVEYSNEVWNWGFPQAQYANKLGRQLWPDEASAWVQFAAGRTHDMCGIWKEVFAGEAARVRCLISPQTGWPELAETVLECPDWVASHPGSGPCYEHVDAINITGYFSGCLHDNAATLQSWLAAGRSAAMSRAFDQLEHGGQLAGCEDSLDATIDAYGYFESLAKPRGLELYVYESGTHFEYSGDEAVRQFLVDLTQDERMYAAYQRNFSAFRAAGGSILNVWGWVAPNDAWANSDSLRDRAHPKYRAISDFAKSNVER
jgi:hypothetical protein